MYVSQLYVQKVLIFPLLPSIALLAQVLKGLALLRMGRHDDSAVLLEEVHSQHPTDEATLQAMAICYREMHKCKATRTLSPMMEITSYINDCSLVIYLRLIMMPNCKC